MYKRQLLNYDGSSVSASYLRLSVLIVFVGTMLQFLLKLLTSVLFALQKTALNNLLFLIGNITVLLYLILVTPVSYTHLDVYKRQLSYTMGWKSASVLMPV